MNPPSLLRSVLLRLAIGLVAWMPATCSAGAPFESLPDASETAGGGAIPPGTLASEDGPVPPSPLPGAAADLRDGDHSHPDPALVDRLYRDLDARLGTSSSRPRLVPPPVWRGGLASKGTVRVPVFLVDFADAPHLASQTPGDVQEKMFGAGDASEFPAESLRAFYQRSSYDQLTIQGDVYGWYRSPYTRAQFEQEAADYEALYADEYGEGIGPKYARSLLVTTVLREYDAHVDFSQYDSDNDGHIDAVFVKWAGERGEWGTLWWGTQGYHRWNATFDGKGVWKFVSSEYSADSARYPGYPFYSPLVDIHETGHLLGLPDYYDYDMTVGPDGGVGGWDMMDFNRGDHNAFSKYLLGWLVPTVVTEGERVIELQPSSTSTNAVLIMPGASFHSYEEFFMAEYRAPGTGNIPNTVPVVFGGFMTGVDAPYTTEGLFVWHVDARLNPEGTNFAYDNSYTEHKLLRLMEADGQEHLEHASTRYDGYFDQADIYSPGRWFGPSTVPNSCSYAGGSTGVGIDRIELTSTGVRARFAVRSVLTVPGGTARPTDTDSDGLVDDVNGNNRADFADVVLYFNQMAWIAANEPLAAFDCNGNGRIDFADIVWLFNHL